MRITWRDGAYRVDRPSYDGGEVVEVHRLVELVETLRQPKDGKSDHFNAGRQSAAHAILKLIQEENL